MGTAWLKLDKETKEGKQTSEYGKKQSGHKREKFQRPSYRSGLLSPPGRYSKKQWRNYLDDINLHL